MPRTEPDIDPSTPSVAVLADYLRNARDKNGFTNPQLAELIGVNVSTVRRAASGRQVPKLSLVLRWAEICKIRSPLPKTLWKRARYDFRLAEFGPRPNVPKTELIRDPADLSAALVECYEKAGAPSVHEMERRAGAHGQLPHNTVDRIIKKLTLPVNRQQCRAFLIACEVPDKEHEVWLLAWTRAVRYGRYLGTQQEDMRRYVLSKLNATPTPSPTRTTSTWQDLGSSLLEYDTRTGPFMN